MPHDSHYRWPGLRLTRVLFCKEATVSCRGGLRIIEDVLELVFVADLCYELLFQEVVDGQGLALLCKEVGDNPGNGLADPWSGPF